MKENAPYGGYILRFEPRRTDKIDADLRELGAVAESFSELDWKFERREVVFLSLTPNQTSLGVVALMERMHGTGGTGKLKMRISDPAYLQPPISAQDLMPTIGLGEWTSSPEHLNRIEPTIWLKLLAAVKSYAPKSLPPLTHCSPKEKKKDACLAKETDFSDS